MFRRVVVVVSVSVALSFACGGNKGSEDAGTGGGSGGGIVGGGAGGGGIIGQLTIDDFCTQYAQAYCDNLVRCGQFDPAAAEGCRTFLNNYQCNEIKESVRRGAESYDSTKAVGCLNAIVGQLQSSCGNGLSVSSTDCQDFIQPAAGSGATCVSSSNCTVEGQTCAGTGCTTTCQDWGALNQPCNYGSCKQGFWCDKTANLCKAPQAAGSTCNSVDTSYNPQCDKSSYCDTTQGKCIALPGPTQACRTSYPQCDQATSYCTFNGTAYVCTAFVANGSGCSYDGMCAPTSFCGSNGTSNVCISKRLAGEACTTSTQCQTDLHCANGTCAAKATEGGACSSSSDCASPYSCDYVTKKCAKSTSRNVGESCTGSTQYCNGSKCVGAAPSTDGGSPNLGTCTAYGPGLPCTQQYDCRSATYCDTDAGTCATSTLGVLCDSASNCQATQYCDTTSHCAARVAAGAPCETDSVCLTPYTCIRHGNDGGLGNCGTPGQAGAPCSPYGENECLQPNLCINNVCTLLGVTGHPCASGGQCFSGACVGMDMDAGVPGTCTDTYVAPGGSCVSSYDCANFECDSTTQTCGAICQ